MRQLSQTALEAVLAPQTEQVFLVLVEIDHETLAGPLRFVRNTEPITHNGNTYDPVAFDINLPASGEDGTPRASITIDNVDRRLTDTIRSVTSRPTITLKIVLASSPDTVELGPAEFKLERVSYDEMQIEGDLVYEDFLTLEYPADQFDPFNFPGLF